MSGQEPRTTRPGSGVASTDPGPRRVRRRGALVTGRARARTRCTVAQWGTPGGDRLVGIDAAARAVPFCLCSPLAHDHRDTHDTASLTPRQSVGDREPARSRSSTRSALAAGEEYGCSPPSRDERIRSAAHRYLSGGRTPLDRLRIAASTLAWPGAQQLSARRTRSERTLLVTSLRVNGAPTQHIEGSTAEEQSQPRPWTPGHHAPRAAAKGRNIGPRCPGPRRKAFARTRGAWGPAAPHATPLHEGLGTDSGAASSGTFRLPTKTVAPRVAARCGLSCVRASRRGTFSGKSSRASRRRTSAHAA